MPDVSLNGIEFKIKGSSDAASDSIDKLIGKLNDLQSALKQTAGVRQLEVGMSSVRTSVAKNIGVWERFKSAIGKVSKVTGSVFFPIKKVASGFKEFAGKIGGVVSGFKRILGYRMIRAIIKDIAKAMEEGAKAAYLFSKNLGDKTKYISKMLDSLSASSKGLGGQMGAAWATLLAAITPIVNQIVAIISRAIQVITQFFALLGGSGVYLKAKNATSDWADETARGAGAAKEWKNQLMGFDELNRLNEPGGGGGGGGATDYGSMFEEVPVEQGVKDFFNSLKAAFDAENWEQLGTLIGEKINDIVENGIAWGEIGAWVGEKINALFTTTYWTLHTINFQNIGAKVAEFLNNALANINFSNLGGIVAEKMTILPDLFIGAINNLNFKTVGKSIHDVVTGFFDNLAGWAEGVNWSEFGTNLVNGLIDLFTGIDTAGILHSAFIMLDRVVGGLAEGIGAAFKAVGDAIKDYFASNGLWVDVKNAFAEKWNSFVNWANQFLPDKLKMNPIEIDVDANPTLTNEGWNQWKQSIQNKGNSDPPSVSAKARFDQFLNSLTGGNKPNLPTNAEFTGAYNNLPNKPSISVNAAMNSAYNALPSKPAISVSAKMNSAYNAFPSKPSVNATANLNSTTISSNITGENRPTIKVKGEIEKTVLKPGYKPVVDITGRVTQTTKASGGVYTSGGWKPITSYASGGSPFGGQIFRARENGNPELVGTIKGSTAVMNNDQIVSSVAYGVQKAIAGIHFQLTGMGTPATVDPDNGANEETIYREFRRALDETDFGGDINLDGNTLYKAMVSRNKKEIFRTGVNPMMQRA